MADKRIRVTADDSALATLQQRIGSFYQSLESDSESWREKSYQDISSIIDQFGELQQAREEFAQARTISVEQNGGLDSGLTDIDRLINEKINQAVAAYRQERVESGMRDLPWDRPADTNNREVIGADKPKETEERVVRQVDETVTREVTEIIKPVEEEAGEQPRNPFDVADETVREEIDDDLARRRAERYKPLTEEEQAEKKKLYADLGWEEEDDEAIDRNAVIDEYEDGSLESHEDTRLRYQRERLYAARAASEREARRRRAEEDRKRQEEERRLRGEESGRDEIEVEGEEPVEGEAGEDGGRQPQPRREYVSPERKLQAELARFRQELEGQDWENMSEDDMNSYWDRTDAFRDRVRQMNGGRYGAREQAQYRDLEKSDTYLAERTRERIEREQASVQPDPSGGGEQGVNSPLTRLVQRIFELLRLRQNNDDTVGGERIVDGGGGGENHRRGLFGFGDGGEKEGGVDFKTLLSSLSRGDVSGAVSSLGGGALAAGAGLAALGSLWQRSERREASLFSADSAVEREIVRNDNSLWHSFWNQGDIDIAQASLRAYKQNIPAQYHMAVLNGTNTHEAFEKQLAGMRANQEELQPGMKNLTFGEMIGSWASAGALTGGGVGTLIAPGLGTAIGASVGAVGGGVTGLIKAIEQDIKSGAHSTEYHDPASMILGKNMTEFAEDYYSYSRAGVKTDRTTAYDNWQLMLAEKTYDLDRSTLMGAVQATRYGTVEGLSAAEVGGNLRANLRKNGYDEQEVGVMLGENLDAYTKLARAYTSNSGVFDQERALGIVSNLTNAGLEGEQINAVSEAFGGMRVGGDAVSKAMRMQAASQAGKGGSVISLLAEQEQASEETMQQEAKNYWELYGGNKDQFELNFLHKNLGISASRIQQMREDGVLYDKNGEFNFDLFKTGEFNADEKFVNEEAAAKVTKQERSEAGTTNRSIAMGETLAESQGKELDKFIRNADKLLQATNDKLDTLNGGITIKAITEEAAKALTPTYEFINTMDNTD